MNTKVDVLEKLLSLYDSVTGVAKALGKDRPVVNYWFMKGYIPVKNAKFIEDATGGAVTEHEVLQWAVHQISSATD